MKPSRTVARLSLRDQLLRNQQSMDLYAALNDKPRVEITGIPPAPKPRAPSTSTVPLERDVQKAIIDGLRRHPRVALVERINSGSALESNADGSKRYIEFSRVYRVDERDLAAVDIHCTLRPHGQRFVIEVKRPGWRGARTPREIAQSNYIDVVIASGGRGIFATSWDEVARELERP